MTSGLPIAVRGRVEIHAVSDDGLGHCSYVVGLGDRTAIVIDPARFPDRQRSIAADRDWTIAWTADTHSHADYISGSAELAGEGAAFIASRAARLEVGHHSIDGGDAIELAPGIDLRAIATPGHTPDHLAYLLVADGEPVALFSGGSLLVGAVGRTDLLGDDRREQLARALFVALRDEILTLPDDLPVYPTHGAGSFCSAPAGAARTTTIGTERTTNPLLWMTDQDAFVASMLEGLGSFPPYFRHLPERNRRGPRVYGAIPTLDRLDPSAVRGEMARGATLVDARPIAEFAAGHIGGSLSIELRPAFASWLGWLVPLDEPLLFVLDARTDRAELVRQCLTIGHENLVGELDGGVDAWIDAGFPVRTIDVVGPDEMRGAVLDVRQEPEWRDGHLPGALHVELGRVADANVPSGPLTLMCGHGERAMTAASILAAIGHQELSVLLGGPDDWAAFTGEALQTA